MSPTLTLAATQRGEIMGTAAYMSPEQARGKIVDKRADIWSFGCILFEMLSGERPFSGQDATDTLASVLRDEPDLNSLPSDVAVSMRELIERCLRKDPRSRLRDIGDARNMLEEIRSGASAGDGAAERTARGRLAGMAPWVLTGTLAVVCIGLTWGALRTDVRAPPVRRYTIDLPWHSVPNWSDFSAALSPTGEHLAYNGRVHNRVDAYVRALDSLEARAVALSREASWYAFSPDGDWIAVLNGHELSKVPLRGGQTTRLADLDIPASPGFSEEDDRSSFRGLQGVFGLSWGPRGDLLIGSPEGIHRVAATGGAPERVTILDEMADDIGHGYPRHLPGGSSALLSVLRSSAPPQVAVADLADGSLTVLDITGIEASYALSGHLVVRQGSSVVAVPFDLAGLKIEGDPVQVADGVEMGPSVADDGTMLYVPTRGNANARLVWTDRSGRSIPVDDERRNYSHLDLRGDGLAAFLNVDLDVYSMDLERGTRQLLASGSVFPIFGPEGRDLTIYRNGSGIFRQSYDGTDEAELLVAARAMRRGVLRSDVSDVASPVSASQSLESPAPRLAGDSAPRGALVPTSWNPRTGDLAIFDDASDLWMLRADGALRPFLRTDANERTGRFSPDGRWLAYVSDETGEYQVYAAEYPEAGRKIPVSIDGGLSPIWSPDGTELFFRNGGKLMAAAITRESDLAFAPPVELFEGPYTLDLMGHQRWDVAPDGERFLMVESSEDFRIVIVQNWFEELTRLVPID
jgi:hypothetical protein